MWPWRYIPLNVTFSHDNNASTRAPTCTSSTSRLSIARRTSMTSPPGLSGCWQPSSCSASSWFGPAHGHPIREYLHTDNLGVGDGTWWYMCSMRREIRICNGTKENEIHTYLRTCTHLGRQAMLTQVLESWCMIVYRLTTTYTHESSTCCWKKVQVNKFINLHD